MGFRFRKSIKIAPGIKYNLSKSGVSLSLGGRGKSINLSSKGIRGTFGIPGSGISYSTNLTSAKKKSSNNITTTNRSVYQELLRQQKEEEKNRKLEDAKQEFEEYQTKICSLSNILKNRDKTIFEWKVMTVSQGEYREQEYIPPQFIEPTPEYFEADICMKLRNEPQKYYLTLFFLGLSFVLFFVNIFIFAFSICVAGVVLQYEYKVKTRQIEEKINSRINQEKNKLKRIRQKQYQDYLKTIDEERLEHIELEPIRREAWEQEENFRKQLREAVENKDIEILADLLEEELSNEELPIPLVFDIEFSEIDTAKIFMELPDLDVVPDDEKSLTKTGKLSSKKMTQTKRSKIYSDICTGLSLRLVYETFRVLPMINAVEIHGMTEIIDSADGHPKTITSLYFQTAREDFEKLNLDNLDPSIAFNSMNGKLCCNKRGELYPVNI